MKKTPPWIFCVLVAIAGFGCNKEVQSVPVPPFSVFPNPFIEDFRVYLDAGLPSNADIRIRILDGRNESIFTWDDLEPGSFLAVNMAGRDKALYYAELQIDQEVFVLPIIKSR